MLDSIKVINSYGIYDYESQSERTNEQYIIAIAKGDQRAVKLLEEKLLSPGFYAEDFKLAKKQYRESVKNDETSANTMASRAFNFALYGNTVMGLDPSTKSIDNVISSTYMYAY